MGSVVVWPLSCALQSAGISVEGKPCRKIKSLTLAFDRTQITTLNCPRYADHAISHELTFIICCVKSLIWVQDDLKLVDDGGEIPNLKEEVGGSSPDYEISSLHDGKLARWSTASCALELACRPSVPKNYKIE